MATVPNGDRAAGSKGQASWIQRKNMALLTDFYELTMMGGYFQSGKRDQSACFEYFFRELPPDNGFVVFAGLEDFLGYCEYLSFEPEDIEYLRSLNTFSEHFLRWLADFRFQCDVYAIPEGSVVFPFCPLVRIEGPVMQVQFVETYLLNALNYATLIATKAARICNVAGADPVIEFGLRRAQGPDGGLSGARAAYIGGCAATSNVMAGRYYDIPVSGTMAHSWVMGFPSELEAFQHYLRHYPTKPILLVDTYDTIKSGVPNAIRAFREFYEKGRRPRFAIRLDSGDLAKLSKVAYSMILDAGFDNPLIVASNELDEDLIADIKRQGARINSWGVGTNLITSKGAPALSGVYKLTAINPGDGWQPRLKVSSNIAKTTDPGRKKPVRYFNGDGKPVGDVLWLEDENFPDGSSITAYDRQVATRQIALNGISRREPLMRRYFDRGARLIPAKMVSAIRSGSSDFVESLPDEIKRLRNPERYPVLFSEKLAHLKQSLLDRERFK